MDSSIFGSQVSGCVILDLLLNFFILALSVFSGCFILLRTNVTNFCFSSRVLFLFLASIQFSLPAHFVAISSHTFPHAHFMARHTPSAILSHKNGKPHLCPEQEGFSVEFANVVSFQYLALGARLLLIHQHELRRGCHKLNHWSWCHVFTHRRRRIIGSGR